MKHAPDPEEAIVRAVNDTWTTTRWRPSSDLPSAPFTVPQLSRHGGGIPAFLAEIERVFGPA